ncbi:hypothetical protein TNCV_2193011 [Trichonephila clavipes]|nr:hypothetical protein TNCV_2193011 [Trichonephila clavipes]
MNVLNVMSKWELNERKSVVWMDLNGDVEKSIPYCLYAQPKIRLSKQQDEDHERYAAQRYPTHVQSVTYPANTQAKEEAVPAANQNRI